MPELVYNVKFQIDDSMRAVGNNIGFTAELMACIRGSDSSHEQWCC
jgi:hypothetical protein